MASAGAVVARAVRLSARAAAPAARRGPLRAAPRARFSTARASRETPTKPPTGLGDGVAPNPGWYSETPSQRLAFQVTVAGAVAFAAYGIYRAWTDYLDPSAAERDEQRVLSTPIIKGNPIVFFDLEVDGEALGRVVFQLRKDVVPKTAENFRQLCVGQPGYGYKGSRIHAVVPGSFLRGGDITHGTGLGGRSASGLPVQDEPHALRHDGPGVLSMVSQGGAGNATSQFYVALSRSPFMDYTNVVMGNVVSGMDVLHTLEKRFKDGPGGQVKIAKSGELRVPDAATQVRA